MITSCFTFLLLLLSLQQTNSFNVPSPLKRGGLGKLSVSTFDSDVNPPVVGVRNTGPMFPETGKVPWDPLGLTYRLDDSGMRWFRAAELKHGRISMIATLGWIAQVNHFSFGGMISPTAGVSFEDIGNASP